MWVNDVAINLFGVVEDEDFVPGQAHAEPSPYAGLRVPREAMDALLRPVVP